ncbi:MAG: hypothetical protein A2087_01970 [Spirochaetes bacterium GWD1_61_31]|nr:MAG: hypothetical protein A2Y37_11700 [Spirochaetes bacterium GWB1_60_80]OHD29931.1 MAG: hypothetical protein A2004_11940 [Spirochaetes bacterium GWC1_61_12]OHD43788.1 MAG: hypothetical protein A2087_01970 [Spirochaetes bacterium GWD1_61_31]OHD46030.1 MAG: hypothetical protein A2Y35_13525 [Spirochaetes bacterium GWE1_60_18]OHD60602.1 MAG: hypothetical protein A2Y32_08015 [Spirochaetes bacterium GWF1_60_12]
MAVTAGCARQRSAVNWFARWRDRRRRALAAAHPVPAEAWQLLIQASPCLNRLALADRAELAVLAAAFLCQKTFLKAVPQPDGTFAYGDQPPAADICLAIAAFACLPVLRLGLDSLRSWRTVIVTPGEYSLRRLDDDGSGVVAEYDEAVVGDMSDYGPLTFSAEDVALSGRGDGYNVVIHEVTHRLDAAAGAVDGVPELPAAISSAEWAAAFAPAYADAQTRFERDRHRGQRHRARTAALIDDYAAESPEEFLAVCAEYFFDDPATLQAAYPAVYALLSRWLSQEPLSSQPAS